MLGSVSVTQNTVKFQTDHYEWNEIVNGFLEGFLFESEFED